MYISFAKAAEVHLNYTILPVLKIIAPNEYFSFSGRNKKLQNVDHAMLGDFKYILNQSYSGTGSTFISKAGQYCIGNMGNFPESWWRKLRDDIELIRTTRNNIPHTGFFSGVEGKSFLRTMFSGNKCLFVRCQNLHDTAVQKNLLPPPPVCAVANCSAK
ncbi:MAG: hypothetical protein MSJ26_03965 [Oscillospiraceae bacterium]|nr:hypothetical protein [Oscillospiraceae bacterium]